MTEVATEVAQSTGLAALRNQTAARRRRSIRLSAIPALPLAVIMFSIFAALAAQLLAPFDPLKQALLDSLQPPAFAGGDPAHFFGTDSFGRDILSRLIFGARITLTVSASVIVIGASVGAVVGMIAGYAGGLVDSLLMRIVDIVMGFPLVLIAIVLVTVLGSSTSNIVLIVSLLMWPRFARMIRSEALGLRGQEFVTVARVIGATDTRIVLRHILPNIIPTLIVIATLEVGAVIVLESSLSFLGVGIPPPEPSWGVMVADGRGQLVSGWWISLFPGIAIMALVLSLNLIGDWLRDKLDPRIHRR